MSAPDVVVAAPERLIGIDEVCRQTGACERRIYAWMQAGRFPRSIKVDSSTRWVESEVQAWIAETIRRYRDEPKHTVQVGNSHREVSRRKAS